MNKIKNKKTTFILIILILIILAIAVSLMVGYFAWYKPLITKRDRQNPPALSESDKKRDDGTPIGAPDPQSTQKQAISIDNVFNDENNIYFGLNLTNITSGICSLTVKQYGNTIIKKGNVELITSYYGCNGMFVAKNEIKPGKYTAQIIINTNGLQVASLEGIYEN